MSTLNPESELAQLMERSVAPKRGGQSRAGAGSVAWIGLRPQRRGPLQPVQEAETASGAGLVGDHFHGQGSGKRQVTLIQGEHLDAVGAFLGSPSADPALTRRNIVVRGLNLFSLKDRRFRIGGALLEYTGPCHPCSRMEENLGAGGYNAMRGHGGITASVLEGGRIHVGDAVERVPLGDADIGDADIEGE